MILYDVAELVDDLNLPALPDPADESDTDANRPNDYDPGEVY